MAALFPVAPLAEATKNPILPASNELIWGGLAFLIVFFVLAKFVFPKAAEALRARTDKIQGDLTSAEAAKEDANRIREEYQHRLAEAREEASRIVADAREIGEQLKRDAQQRAQEESNRMIESARAEIEAERTRVESELRKSVGGLAVQVAERVVGWQLDEDRQRELVDRYIDELTAAGAPGGSNGNGSGGAAS